MDGVLVNPADRLSPQEYAELQNKLSDLMNAFGLSKSDLPKGLQNIPAPITPASLEEALELTRTAYLDNRASIIAFMPQSKDGKRAVNRAIELEQAPARNPGYFTIHRTGLSRSGVKRNFGVSLRLADTAEAAKLKVQPGDLIASGYDVLAKDESAPATPEN